MPSLFAQGSNARDIAEGLEYAMRSGALQPGDPLPAVRRLASDLGVNPNTVAAAYARLRNAGRLTTAGRHGTHGAQKCQGPRAGGNQPGPCQFLRSGKSAFGEESMRGGTQMDLLNSS